MSNFRPIKPRHCLSAPPSVDEWLPQRHLARFLVEVIDDLDLSQLEKSYRGSGSASCHPARLAGLRIYGYATRSIGMLKPGTVALDGTRERANASHHRALSYGHAGKEHLRKEVLQLLELAERADAADVPDGMLIPKLEGRGARLEAIAEAKAKIRARVNKRDEAEYQSKIPARSVEQQRAGQKSGGCPPAPPPRGG